MMITCLCCGSLSRQLAGILDGITLSWPVTFDGLRTASDAGCKFCREIANRLLTSNTSEVETVHLAVRLLDRESEPYREPEFEKIEVKLSPKRSLWFYICAYEDDPAGQDFITRPLRLDVGSPDAFVRIRQWILDCQGTHHNCPKSNQEPYLPRRVIDVGSSDANVEPHLHTVSLDERELYIALSYCWGGPQPVTTTNQTLGLFSSCISLMKLPQTLQDAIFVTRRLGIRYLWVDALCIIQDSEDDKAEQVQNMAKIYEQAYITISATSAVRCQDGFLTTRHVSSFEESIVLPYNCRDGRPGVLYLRIDPQWRDGGHVMSTRAWTFQERLLSARTVSYGKRLSWQCQTKDDFFDGQDDGSNNEHGFSGQIRLKNNIFKTASASAGVWEPSLLKDWRNLIKNYMIRKISDPHDKLPALAGIASQFQQMTGDVYIAGLWQRDLIVHLAWRAAPEFGDYCGRGPTVCSPVERAPSWSWASVDGFVGWDIVRTSTSSTPACDILDVRVRLLNPSAPLGRVASGRLTVGAHCRELLLSMLDAPIQCLADPSSFLQAVEAFKNAATSHPVFSWDNPDHLIPWLTDTDPPTNHCILDCPDDSWPECNGDISGFQSIPVTCLPLIMTGADKMHSITYALVLRKLESGFYRRVGFCYDFQGEWSTAHSPYSVITIV